MKWTTKPDGHEYAKYKKCHLRMRHVQTGWIISRQVLPTLGGMTWEFVAGHQKRETAIAKAREILCD